MSQGRERAFDWAGHTARMISSIGRDEVAATAIAALSDLVDFEHTGVFLFRRHKCPRDLLAGHYDQRYHQTYVSGTYRLDPFYRGAERSETGGLYRMAELDPGYQSYLARYEMGPRVADVLPPGYPVRPAGSGKLREEIGFLLPVGGARMVHIALIRSTALAPFEESEIDALKALAPVLQAVFESHFRRRAVAELACVDDEAPTIGGTSASAASWRQRLKARLTERERELVEYMLLGLLTEQIATRMGIAGSTVKVHRRNIYRKLAVSSRDELVARCFANGLRPAGSR